MADFNIAFDLTMKVEGGYQCDKDDKGNYVNGVLVGTKYGITAPELMNFLGRMPTAEEMKNLSLETVKAIYERDYWGINKLDEVKDQRIANEMFDTGVNCGIVTAAKFLQRALNLSNVNQFAYKNISVDGVIGSQTLQALNNHKKPDLVLKILNVLQGNRYIEICERNEVMEKFMNSWMSRVNIG